MNETCFIAGVGHLLPAGCVLRCADWAEGDRDYNLTELDPDDVLTSEQAAELLEPDIKPVPPFDETLLPGART